jgi:hypothetical protein
MEWHMINKNHRFLKGENKIISMRNLRCRTKKFLKKGLNCKLMTLEYRWNELKAIIK